MILGIAFCVGHWQAVLADETEDYVRTEWGVPPAYSIADIHRAFSARHYGITWHDWADAFLGGGKIFDEFGQGEYLLGGQELSARVTEEALEAIVEESVVLAFPIMRSLAIHALEVGFQIQILTSQVAAYRHQHTLYFLARPYNTAAEIRDLGPFDLLNGVDITKEGRGWLFDYSGYLRPYPNNQGLTPAQFWPLAESAWVASGLNATAFAAEEARIRDAFLAYMPIAKAENSLSISANHAQSSVTLSWACIAGLTYGIESSPDLLTWHHETAITPTASQVDWTVSVDLTAGRIFFRLRMIP